MDEPKLKQRAGTPWPLLAFLLLSLAAGGFALFGVVEEKPAWLASLMDTRQAEKAPEPPANEPPRAPFPITPQAPGPVPPPAVPSTPFPTAGFPLSEARESATPDPATDAPAASEDGERASAVAAEAPEPDQGAHSGPETAPDNDPDAAESSAPSRKPDAARPDAPAGDDDGVILYGKARPLTRGGNVVRGEIPPGQRPASFSRRAFSGGDSLVTPDFVEDFARFLADNYWPRGTHTLARNRGVSTAGVKWANMRYGAQLHGFHGDKSRPDRLRQRVMDYVFMPSMIRGLYGLYQGHFFSALENQALARGEGPQGAYFTNAQVADMFALYATTANELAGCVRAYRGAPGVRAQVSAYADAHTEADSAFKRFMESMQAGEADKGPLSERYYESVRRRESARRSLARSLRGNGGLDDDSLVYVALWLYRRGPGQDSALSALEEICADSAARLKEMEARYRALPARQIARPGDAVSGEVPSGEIR
jgi:hypothetical protein